MTLLTNDCPRSGGKFEEGGGNLNNQCLYSTGIHVGTIVILTELGSWEWHVCFKCLLTKLMSLEWWHLIAQHMYELDGAHLKACPKEIVFHKFRFGNIVFCKVPEACILVHNILFEIPLSCKDICSHFWLVKTMHCFTKHKAETSQSEATTCTYPCDSLGFETRYRARIHRLFKPTD